MEAEIEREDFAAVIGILLPGQEPVLNSRRLAVPICPAELVQPAAEGHPARFYLVTLTVTALLQIGRFSCPVT